MKIIVCTASSAVSLFIIIIPYFLIPISNANPSVDDEMLIAFVKENHEMQISEYSKQKYEAYLGIVYFMRKNWQCDKIHEKFDEFERTECQKYGQYLNILYEYLYREYVGIPTVKPIFVFKNRIEIEGPINYAVNCLVKISQFYFNSIDDDLYSEYKLNIHFNNYNNFEPKLLNEQRLTYLINFENELPKVPINEMILQLAIDTANEWQLNEIMDVIIREIFDQNLEEMFKKAEEKAKKDKPSRAYTINNNKHNIILYSKFDDQNTWFNDALF